MPKPFNNYLDSLVCLNRSQKIEQITSKMFSFEKLKGPDMLNYLKIIYAFYWVFEAVLVCLCFILKLKT